jgi:hypothetical protein
LHGQPSGRADKVEPEERLPLAAADALGRAEYM